MVVQIYLLVRTPVRTLHPAHKANSVSFFGQRENSCQTHFGMHTWAKGL
jgi:hypothetical protein